MQRGGLIVYSLSLLLLLPLATADRLDEDCEACGVLVWRMQTIVAHKAKQLEDVKKAKEKRAAKSKKAHSRRWLRQEYGVELSSAIEAEVDALAKDSRIVNGVCRPFRDGIEGSALRGGRMEGKRCSSRVQSRVEELLSEQQDDLVGAVVAGKGAGAACSKLLPRCSAARATLLLGAKYRDEMDCHELEYLQIGYADAWSLHKDVDGSVYWFNKATMTSVKDPPPGWAKDADGEWRQQQPEAVRSESDRDEL